MCGTYITSGSPPFISRSGTVPMTLQSLHFSMVVGATMTLFCIYLLRPLAIHINLVDSPGGRKRHRYPVPLIGGVALFIGLCFALLALDISLRDYRGLLAGSALLILIGVVDDFKELSPRIRLWGQFLAAVMLIAWGHLSFQKLGNAFSFGEISTGIFAFPLTILFVLGFINAMNMIDGNDGLAGSVALFQTLFLAYLFYSFHQWVDFYVLSIFSVLLLVFLLFNFPVPWRKHPSIFMGDAGSTFIGFFIAWFAIGISQIMLATVSLHRGFNGMTVIWILAYPLYDLMIVTVHRIFSGRSPLKAARDHLHHLLIDAGLSRTLVTMVLLSFSVFLGVLGIVLANFNISESRQLFIFGSAFIVYWLVRQYTQTTP